MTEQNTGSVAADRPVCKGDPALGSSCGVCSRCRLEATTSVDLGDIKVGPGWDALMQDIKENGRRFSVLVEGQPPIGEFVLAEDFECMRAERDAARDDVERICEKVRSFEKTSLTCSRIQGETIARLRRERDQVLAGELPLAWLDVHAERRRQVEEEAFDSSHDDMATRGQIARAAGCYALHAGGVGTSWPEGIRNGSALFWPWDRDWWKPKAPRDALIRAGALIFAELERLDRAAAAAQGGE
ncbi:hypothetical protein [Pseudomonas nicosulfuronedens]